MNAQKYCNNTLETEVMVQVGWDFFGIPNPEAQISGFGIYFLPKIPKAKYQKFQILKKIRDFLGSFKIPEIFLSLDGILENLRIPAWMANSSSASIVVTLICSWILRVNTFFMEKVMVSDWNNLERWIMQICQQSVVKLCQHNVE